MKQAGRISDFTIKIIMMFSAIISLLFFWDYYNQPIFLFLCILLILSIIIKGISDIFDKQ